MRTKILSLLALLITAVGGAWAQTETLLTTITPTAKTTYSETTAGVVTVTPSGQAGYSSMYGWLWGNMPGSVTVEAKEGYTITQCVFKQNDKTPVTITTSPFAITFANGICVEDAKKFMNGVTSIEVYGYSNADDPEVTLNDDKTEATMESMPTYDVDFNYELVRDMSVQMQAQVGNGTDGVRYRVQWNDEKDTFEPADMDMMQVLELFSVYDGIEGTTVAPKNYLVNIWAVDDEGNPTGEAMDFTNFTFAPGRYCVTASALLDAPYDGTTAPSNIFELFQGYQVVIPAGEYVTYYKDEPLYVEDEAAVLYTISSVDGDKAVLSDKSDAMPSNTPMLVYNNSDKTKVILLIPCAEPDLAITVAPEFKGTLEAATIPASSATSTNYAFNGKAFVWVKDAVAVDANRAWLEIPAVNEAREIKLVFGEATGINGVNAVKDLNGAAWYDLNGRKLQAAPTKKGIYIMNGRKVVVK